MLKKEFKKKDVERMRNLIKGNTNSSTEIQIGYTKKQEDYKEGDIWEENGKTWTLKNGIKQTATKLDKIKKEATMPLFCPNCGKLMKHHLNAKFYKIHKLPIKNRFLHKVIQLLLIPSDQNDFWICF